MKIKKVRSFDNKFWLKVKLVIIKTPYGELLYTPFLVSETEGSQIGDVTLFPNTVNGEIKWDDIEIDMVRRAKYDYAANGCYNLKVVAHPENFPIHLLTKIENGEFKMGDDLLIECEEILGDDGILAVIFGEAEYKIKLELGKLNYEII